MKQDQERTGRCKQVSRCKKMKKMINMWVQLKRRFCQKEPTQTSTSHDEEGGCLFFFLISTLGEVECVCLYARMAKLSSSRPDPKIQARKSRGRPRTLKASMMRGLIRLQLQ
ncbi:hypothetical protein LAZ67_23000123 [Cordylochernes scorpioides]|uniref:Uncharacterized protein n=1 Tax=Cordylochernes scorpioides TaxID=51811 RepID=A0ABY6LPQ3_9ARAC|nr:hypothetical protein LAZ67_23000123 [Cordylochernes scorpioides]